MNFTNNNTHNTKYTVAGTRTDRTRGGEAAILVAFVLPTSDAHNTLLVVVVVVVVVIVVVVVALLLLLLIL